MQIAILNAVIWQLQQDLKEDKSRTALYAVIDNYNKRLENLILDQESNEVKSDLALINIMILGIESDGLESIVSIKVISSFWSVGLTVASSQTWPMS